MKLLRPLFITAALVSSSVPAAAQTFRTDDPVIRRIWTLGMDSSRVEPLAQALVDSIGQRLSGTVGFQNSVEWVSAMYRGWGITARQEQYGTTRGWRMGPVALALVAPQVQTLEVQLLAFSPGTGGRPVEGEVVALPAVADAAAAQSWIGTVRGRYVLVSPPEVTCRAPQELEQYALPATVQRIAQQRQAIARDMQARLAAFGGRAALDQRLAQAGAAGIIASNWSGGWGVNKIFGANTDAIPSVDVSCEHYGMLWRLASNNQGPRIRLTADAEQRPEQPMFNVIAELRGRELPNEYVLLSAHLDSWHGANGATDNGTGTVMMMEAMRILSRAYPNPRRTILVGHWGGEEQGLRGSSGFGRMHPDVLQGMQAVFNQDNGTWRIELLEGQAFIGAAPHLARWLSQVPAEIADHVTLQVPGPQANAGSDHTAFICHGVPAFRLQSSYTEYRQYTWHTNRDTFDKIIMDDLRNNATLAAMMAYAASEDPQRVPRDRAILPPQPNGQPRAWPTCRAQ
jgi:carboxypeptidase Q